MGAYTSKKLSFARLDAEGGGDVCPKVGIYFTLTFMVHRTLRGLLAGFPVVPPLTT